MMPTVIHERCSGCGACKLACAMENFNAVQPTRALLWIQGRFPAPGDYRIHFCDQCGECADNCPVAAIGMDSGVYRVDQECCTGCQTCIEVCPKGVMVAQPGAEFPSKCILCGACAEICPRSAIVMTMDGH
ncbi:MAG: 4Fe-4S binding protein [Desulfosarcina sp.]